MLIFYQACANSLLLDSLQVPYSLLCVMFSLVMGIGEMKIVERSKWCTYYISDFTSISSTLSNVILYVTPQPSSHVKNNLTNRSTGDLRIVSYNY